MSGLDDAIREHLAHGAAARGDLLTEALLDQVQMTIGRAPPAQSPAVMRDELTTHPVRVPLWGWCCVLAFAVSCLLASWAAAGAQAARYDAPPRAGQAGQQHMPPEGFLGRPTRRQP